MRAITARTPVSRLIDLLLHELTRSVRGLLTSNSRTHASGRKSLSFSTTSRTAQARDHATGCTDRREISGSSTMRSQEARAVIPFVSRLSRGASEGGSPMAKSVYDEACTRSMEDPGGFWARAAEAIHWEKRRDLVVDDSRKPLHRCAT